MQVDCECVFQAQQEEAPEQTAVRNMPCDGLTYARRPEHLRLNSGIRRFRASSLAGIETCARREQRGSSQQRADRAPDRAAGGAPRCAGALRLPARRAVCQRLPEARATRPRHLLRRLHRDGALDRGAHCAELLPPPALAQARQRAHARRLERLDDRRARLPRLGDHEHCLRDHRLPVPPRLGGDVHLGCRARVPRALVRTTACVRYSGSPETETASMTTSSCGLSRGSRGSSEILSTTSIPPVTLPNTVCLPSSQGAASVVTMKNWLPFVFGPAFAIASAPRSTLRSLNSSSNV